MSEPTVCPQCDEPISRASGSGRAYCNLCGWVDVDATKPSAAERHMLAQQIAEQELQRKREQQAEQLRQAGEQLRQAGQFVSQQAEQLGPSAKRFPGLNLLMVFYYLLFGGVLFAGLYLFKKAPESEYAGLVIIGVTVALAVICLLIAEGIKLGLAIELHLYQIKQHFKTQNTQE